MMIPDTASRRWIGWTQSALGTSGNVVARCRWCAWGSQCATSPAAVEALSEHARDCKLRPKNRS